MGPFWTGTKSEFSDSWFHLGRSMKGAEKEAVWFFIHRCNLSLKSPSQIHVTGQFVHSSKQKYHIKPASCWKSSRQQMAKLCIHLEQGHLDPLAFTSLHSSQRPSFLCHIDIQRCPCPLRCWTLCPSPEKHSEIRVILLTHSHLTYSQGQRQSTPWRSGLSPFSVVHGLCHCVLPLTAPLTATDFCVATPAEYPRWKGKKSKAYLCFFGIS